MAQNQQQEGPLQKGTIQTSDKKDQDLSKSTARHRHFLRGKPPVHTRGGGASSWREELLKDVE